MLIGVLIKHRDLFKLKRGNWVNLITELNDDDVVFIEEEHENFCFRDFKVKLK